VRTIKAVDGIAAVRIIAPHRSGFSQSPAKIKVTLDTDAQAIFTLPEARAWLAADQAAG
jgi:hypothetical protein